VLSSGEGCDDGNTASGDGCSSSCSVEDNYACSGQPSVCQMVSWSATRVSVLKDTGDNAFTATFKFQPGKNPAYSTLDWSTVISQTTQLPISIVSVSYDIST
jgi:cysteine-rich repeat protein